MVTLTAQAEAGSTFIGWSGACSGAGLCAITMDAHKTVDADFTPTASIFTITAGAGTNGSISPSGTVIVNAGADHTFTITPNTGYHTYDVLVDGKSVGGRNSYSFTNVTANHTISASFTVNGSSPLDNWIRRASGVSTDLLGVAYGNNTFVAMGGGGLVLTSPDGVNWTTRSAGTTDYLGPVAYGNGTFVATGHAIITSTDGGITWQYILYSYSTLYGVTYGNGLFVSVGMDGTILTSPDGKTWTYRTSGITSGLSGVAYGNGIFVATGVNGVLLTSSNGITWTRRSSGTSDFITSVTFGNGTFAAVVTANYSSSVLTSPNGITWTKRSHGTTTRPGNITFGYNSFVTSGGGNILTSPDGISWTDRRIASAGGGITYGNGTFVNVGYGGVIIQSDQLVSPNITISPSSYNFGDGFIGTISTAQTFTVSNSGYASLVLGTIALTGDSADFLIQNDNCSNKILAPAATCTFGTAFQPASEGTLSANLVLHSNDSDTPDLSVLLSGTGMVLIPPETTLTGQPPDPANRSWAEFTFISSDAGVIFECELDGDGSGYEICASPKTYSGLTIGGHTFAVRAVKAGAPDPTPATYSWAIEAIFYTVSGVVADGATGLPLEGVGAATSSQSVLTNGQGSTFWGI